MRDGLLAIEGVRWGAHSGVAFGHDIHLRLSYAISDDVIDDRVARIQRFFAGRCPPGAAD